MFTYNNDYFYSKIQVYKAKVVNEQIKIDDTEE